jgi:hypothetical protein
MRSAKRLLAMALLLLISSSLVIPLAYAADTEWEVYPYDTTNEHFDFFIPPQWDIIWNINNTNGGERTDLIYNIPIDIRAIEPGRSVGTTLLQEDLIKYKMTNIPSMDEIVYLRSSNDIENINGHEVWIDSKYELDFGINDDFPDRWGPLSTYEYLKKWLTQRNYIHNKSHEDQIIERTISETTMFGYNTIVETYTSTLPYVEFNTGDYAEYTYYYIVIDDIDLPTDDPTQKHPYMSIETVVNTSFHSKTMPDDEGDIEGKAFFNQTKSAMTTALNDFLGTGSITVEREANVLIADYKPGTDSKKTGTVNTDADSEGGETDVSIPEALAIVIIGGATAIVGAGTGSGSDDSSKKKNRYKMCLRKDFGDAIRYDTQPVTVYARIVEITPEGEEIDRPDLSARIEMFSGGGLMVEGTAISDNYMGALVCAESVPGGQNPDSGVLSIRFSGEGGSFQNNVTFRLVGDAAIHFPERGKMLTPTTYMLYGDNGDYQVPIELIDFILPPQKVRLELPGNQPFTAETERIDDTHYIIHLHNTSPIQTDKAQPQQIFMVFVYAENEKESAHDNFLVNLLPEGLSLRPFTGCPIDENGRLQVVCSLAPEQGEAEVEIEKTEFQLVLCVSQIDESGRKQAILVDSNSMDCRFDPMTAESEKLQNLLKAFVYEMEFSEAKRTGIFRICPKRQLPQDDRLDYDIALPVSCDYKDQTYTLDIPIRLLGDKLLPMAEKSEEIALLIKRIRKFVDEEERAALIRGFKNDLPKMSATDVRLLSKSLVYATQAEVYKANMHLLNAEMLDWVCWGLDWYKWIGDQAISVIISKLSYNYAPFVEAIVMPAKDLLVEHMGIWLSNYISGSPSPSAEFDLEQLESTGLTMIENILTNLIDGKTEPKKAAQILSVYLVIRTAHAYFYETNDDGSPIGIYGAIASAFGDLTAQSFKIILGTKLEQLAKNPATTKMFGGYADEFVKGLFPAEFYNNGGEWEFDLIKKYIEEITVLASAKVYSGIQEGAEQDTVVGDIIVTLIENTEDPEKTVRIAVNPLDLGKEFFDYIFDRLFGMFSFADSAVESPKDPPCILA